MFQSSANTDGCGFVRWVDPASIHPHQEYIEYLQNHIFDLEMEVSSGNNEKEEDENKGPNTANEMEVSMHYSILQLPVSQQQWASGSAGTASTSCYGSILWRQFDTIC